MIATPLRTTYLRLIMYHRYGSRPNEFEARIVFSSVIHNDASLLCIAIVHILQVCTACSLLKYVVFKRIGTENVGRSIKIICDATDAV